MGGVLDHDKAVPVAKRRQAVYVDRVPGEVAGMMARVRGVIAACAASKSIRPRHWLAVDEHGVARACSTALAEATKVIAGRAPHPRGRSRAPCSKRWTSPAGEAALLRVNPGQLASQTDSSYVILEAP